MSSSLQRNDRHERNKSIGESIHSGGHHITSLLNSTMDAGITNVFLHNKKEKEIIIILVFNYSSSSYRATSSSPVGKTSGAAIRTCVNILGCQS